LLAQLKVANTGYVGIGLNTSAVPLSSLSIGGNGFSDTKVFITGTSTALNVIRTGSSNNMCYYGLNISTDVTGGFNYGIKSQSLAPFSSYSGRTYGLFGVGGNGSSGYNYGVFGQLSGNNYGAGVGWNDIKFALS